MDASIRRLNDQFNSCHKLKQILKEKGYNVISERWVNFQRDCELVLNKNNEIKKVYFKYKRSFFISFQLFFQVKKVMVNQ